MEIFALLNSNKFQALDMLETVFNSLPILALLYLGRHTMLRTEAWNVQSDCATPAYI